MYNVFLMLYNISSREADQVGAEDHYFMFEIHPFIVDMIDAKAYSFKLLSMHLSPFTI